jgi:LmbE family N-acetylglucosaminyl deacetylase
MKTIVVAPHPDDEVLGSAGTILRRKAEGAEVAWLIVTGMKTESGWTEEQIGKRAAEIEKIKAFFQFDEVFQLNFPPAGLNSTLMGDLINAISHVFQSYQPEEVLVPHPSDVHSDHRYVFDAVTSCSKWFRYPYIKRILAYETLSETGFALKVSQPFIPTVFINITPYLDEKLQAMDIYASELGDFPFPRSHSAICALAHFRGALSGFEAAEAFELLSERM